MIGRRALVTSLALVLTCSILPGSLGRVYAAFDPNFVISDTEALETSSYDSAGIHSFLLARGSYLATYKTTDVDGVARWASEIIRNASVRNSISPRMLLALLEREQSLMTDPSPTQKQLDWATGYAICDSCSMNDPSLAKYKGFAVQVESAAANLRVLIEDPPSYVSIRGKTRQIDGIAVTPATRATASLYSYTPHVLAQQNFWGIWQKYFARRHPSGTLLRAPGISGTWLLQDGKRRKLASGAVLMSRYDPFKVLAVSANDLLAYEEGKPVMFANYSLVRSPKGTIYLLVDDTRRGIVSREVFRKLGFDPSEVTDASWEDIEVYSEAEPITLASAYPTGALLKEPASPGVYFVEGGVKHPLYGKELLSLYFKGRKILKTTKAELDGLATGEPIKLKDGELVKTADAGTVYVISEGQRLPIPSAEAFEKAGWQWKNVVVVSPKVLDLTPAGQPVESSTN